MTPNPGFVKFDAESGSVILNGNNFTESGKTYYFQYNATTVDGVSAFFSFSIQTSFKNSPPVF